MQYCNIFAMMLLIHKSSFKARDILRRNCSTNIFDILEFPLHEAMMPRKMFNEIITIDSFVN